MNIALIVFAGSGSRIHSELPKQFIRINDVEMVVYTIRRFQTNPNIDEIVLVTAKEYIEYTQNLVENYELTKVKKIVEGGNTRQESVRLGLEAIDYDDDENILIHDGDRPLVSNAIINNVIMHLQEFKAVCPFIDQGERIVEISNSGRESFVDNKKVDIQTPQGFKFGLIKQAHIDGKSQEFSDDIGLVQYQVEVKYFEGEKENFKVTEDRDLEFLDKMLR